MSYVVNGIKGTLIFKKFNSLKKITFDFFKFDLFLLISNILDQIEDNITKYHNWILFINRFICCTPIKWFNHFSGYKLMASWRNSDPTQKNLTNEKIAVCVKREISLYKNEIRFEIISKFNRQILIRNFIPKFNLNNFLNTCQKLMNWYISITLHYIVAVQVEGRRWEEMRNIRWRNESARSEHRCPNLWLSKRSPNQDLWIGSLTSSWFLIICVSD